MSSASESSAARLRASGVRAGYRGRVVLDGVDLAIGDAAVTVIIGPNGSGKSTLLRTLGRILAPTAGEVMLHGRAIASYTSRDVARQIGMLPQNPTAPEGLTVADLVARARQPHQSWLRQWSRDDDAAARRALELAGVADLADRLLDELSGGQRQRAWIAFVLAQETEVILLDEPTTYLDLAHAIDVLDLVDDLHRDHGRTVVMVLHDLNLALRVATRLVVMDRGAVVADGAPAAVLTADLLATVFGLRAAVIANPVGAGLVVVPLDR